MYPLPSDERGALLSEIMLIEARILSNYLKRWDTLSDRQKWRAEIARERLLKYEQTVVDDFEC